MKICSNYTINRIQNNFWSGRDWNGQNTYCEQKITILRKSREINQQEDDQEAELDKRWYDTVENFLMRISAPLDIRAALDRER